MTRSANFKKGAAKKVKGMLNLKVILQRQSPTLIDLTKNIFSFNVTNI